MHDNTFYKTYIIMLLSLENRFDKKMNSVIVGEMASQLSHIKQGHFLGTLGQRKITYTFFSFFS